MENRFLATKSEKSPEDLHEQNLNYFGLLSDSFERMFSGIDAGDTSEISEYARRFEQIRTTHFQNFILILEGVLESNDTDVIEYFGINLDIPKLQNLHVDYETQFKHLSDSTETARTLFIKLLEEAPTDLEKRRILLRLLTNIKDVFIKKVETTRELIPIYKEDFKKVLRIALKNPDDYDFDKIDKVVDNIPIELHDPFLSPLTKGSAAGAISDGYIILNITFGPYYTSPDKLADPENLEYDVRDAYAEKLKEFFFHELLHTITTGNTLINRTDTGKDSIRRVGFKTHGRNTSRFEWLNEAVTQLHAERLLLIEANRASTTKFGSRAYDSHIKLFNLLERKSKNPAAWIHLFYSYFESLHKDTSTSTYTWSTARKEIEESIGDVDKNFLVKLDIFILSYPTIEEGILDAINIVSQWKDGEPKPEDFHITTNP